MIGRAAYKYPWNFRNADMLLYGAKRNPNLSRREIIERYIDYAEDLQERWGSDKILDKSKFAMPTTTLVKPLLSLFKYVMQFCSFVSNEISNLAENMVAKCSNVKLESFGVSIRRIVQA